MTEATTRLFHCSFCLKPQTEVEKLIAGPGVYICNACVDLCIPIMAATAEPLDPASINTPQTMTTDRLLTLLKLSDGAAERIDLAMRDVCDILRERDVSWAAIGEALGVSRQAAWKRFG